MVATKSPERLKKKKKRRRRRNPDTQKSLRQANEQIREAWIAALLAIFASFFLLQSTYSHPLDQSLHFQMGHITILGALTAGVYGKNRICAILLLIYFSMSHFFIALDTKSAAPLYLVALVALFLGQGIRGTSQYHKLNQRRRRRRRTTSSSSSSIGWRDSLISHYRGVVEFISQLIDSLPSKRSAQQEPSTEGISREESDDDLEITSLPSTHQSPPEQVLRETVDRVQGTPQMDEDIELHLDDDDLEGGSEESSADLAPLEERQRLFREVEATIDALIDESSDAFSLGETQALRGGVKGDMDKTVPTPSPWADKNSRPKEIRTTEVMRSDILERDKKNIRQRPTTREIRSLQEEMERELDDICQMDDPPPRPPKPSTRDIRILEEMEKEIDDICDSAPPEEDSDFDELFADEDPTGSPAQEKTNPENTDEDDKKISGLFTSIKQDLNQETGASPTPSEEVQYVDLEKAMKVKSSPPKEEREQALESLGIWTDDDSSDNLPVENKETFDMDDEIFESSPTRIQPGPEKESDKETKSPWETTDFNSITFDI